MVAITVGILPAVGVFPFCEPTANSNNELTVLATHCAGSGSGKPSKQGIESDASARASCYNS